MRNAALALLVLVLALGLHRLRAQVVYIDDPNPGVGSSNSIPWNQANGYTSLHVYTAAQFAAQGVCAGAALTDFAIDPISIGPGNYSAAQLRLQIGHLSFSPPIAGNWTTHLVNPVTVHDLSSGPYSFPWSGSTWVPLPGFVAAGFVWNGVSDIGVLVTMSAGATGTFNIRRSNNNLRHGVNVFNATNENPTTIGDFAMKARLTFSGGTRTFQGNQPAASFDIDGVVPPGACSPATVFKCLGATSVVHIASTNTGLGWDLALTFPEPLVPLGAGALQLPASGQLININVAAPSLTFLNSFTFPPIPSAAFSVTFSSSAPLTVAGQMAVFDPTNADGVALSSGVNLTYAATNTIQGPVADDSFITVNLAAQFPCLPSTTLPFYGASQTQIYVTTNGRVCFYSGSTSHSASLASAMQNPGTAGYWCDLDQSLGGSITVTGTQSGILRVDYNGVPYYNQPSTSVTFSIIFDILTGSIRLDGLAGIGVHPAAGQAFLGLSPGLLATNPGPTPFAPAASGSTFNPTNTLYQLGTSGTLTPGLSSIIFTPDLLGNYTWVSL